VQSRCNVLHRATLEGSNGSVLVDWACQALLTMGLSRGIHGLGFDVWLASWRFIKIALCRGLKVGYVSANEFWGQSEELVRACNVSTLDHL
jgi:hypothetical protein